MKSMERTAFFKPRCHRMQPQKARNTFLCGGDTRRRNFLFFGTRQHDRTDDGFLENAEEHEHGDQRQHRSRDDLRHVVIGIRTDPAFQVAQRNGHVIPFFRTDEHFGGKVVVPRTHETQNPLRHDRRHAQRNNKQPENAPVTRSVDFCRFHDGGRQAVQVLTDKECRHDRTETAGNDHGKPVGRPVERRVQAVLHDDQCGERDHDPEHAIEKRYVLALKIDLCKRKRRRGRHDDADHDRHHRIDDRVQNDPPIVGAFESVEFFDNARVVFKDPALDQGFRPEYRLERIHRAPVHRRHQHPPERIHHGQRAHDQDHVRDHVKKDFFAALVRAVKFAPESEKAAEFTQSPVYGIDFLRRRDNRFVFNVRHALSLLASNPNSTSVKMKMMIASITLKAQPYA